MVRSLHFVFKALSEVGRPIGRLRMVEFVSSLCERWKPSFSHILYNLLPMGIAGIITLWSHEFCSPSQISVIYEILSHQLLLIVLPPTFLSRWHVETFDFLVYGSC